MKSEERGARRRLSYDLRRIFVSTKHHPPIKKNVETDTTWLSFDGKEKCFRREINMSKLVAIMDRRLRKSTCWFWLIFWNWSLSIWFIFSGSINWPKREGWVTIIHKKQEDSHLFLPPSSWSSPKDRWNLAINLPTVILSSIASNFRGCSTKHSHWLRMKCLKECVHILESFVKPRTIARRECWTEDLGSSLSINFRWSNSVTTS